MNGRHYRRRRAHRHPQEVQGRSQHDPAELEKWLETDQSKEVGWKGEDGHGSGESVGHKSGKRIVELLRTGVDDLSADDLAHMKKVTGYVHRHMAQKPAHPDGSRWEASLKNWGHDPAKK